MSWALIADALHTLGDLFCDLMLFCAAYFSSSPPDQEHPYGHLKLETLASMAVGVILFAMASILLWELLMPQSGEHLIHQSVSYVPLLVAFYSMLQNEGLYHWVMSRARSVNSDLLVATAWHQRADALSSFVVLVGLGGSWLGFVYADIMAATVVGVLIIKMASGILMKAADELIDRSVDQKDYDRIWGVLVDVVGAEQVVALRTRVTAGRVNMDASLVLAGDLSLKDVAVIKAKVKERLLGLPDILITDIVIEVDCN